MFRVLRLATVFSSIISVTVAYAADSAPGTQANPSRWSLAIGIQVAEFSEESQFKYQTCTEGLSCLIQEQNNPDWSSPPKMSVVVERKLGIQTALMLGLSVHARDFDTSSDLENFRAHEELTDVGVGVGLRYKFNPGSVIEFSTYLGFQGHWLDGETENPTGFMEARRLHYTYDGYQLTSNIGLVLEHKLTDWLHLRLASSLFEVGYIHTDGIQETFDSESSLLSERKTTSNGMSYRLHLDPRIMLRLSF
jgi:hypothetical protein